MEKILKIIPLLYYDIAAIIFFTVFLICLRSKSDRFKKRILYALCVANFIFYIINDFYFYRRGDNLLTLMPLQLCNIAVFLVPAAIISNKPSRASAVMDFVFYICTPGALAALLVPSSDYVGKTYSLMTISFFIFHFMIVAIPFLLAGWGMYHPAPTIKKAWRLSISVFAIAAVMHLLNLGLGLMFKVEANYFFTVINYSAPRNPLFDLFSRIIPLDLFYLLPSLPVLYVYMTIVHLFTGLIPKHFKMKPDMVPGKQS